MQLEDLNIRGQRVIMRVDFNVPLDDSKNITDDTRIVKALPTINYILSQGGRLILMSHLGRPQKKKNEDGTINTDKFSLKNLLPYLSKTLNKDVKLLGSPFGETAVSESLNMLDGDVAILENTRFHVQESKGDVEFASRLSALGDIYINDAFGAAHRAHASTTTVARFFPSHRKAFGLLMRSEIESADQLLKSPSRPFTAIVGGAKVSDKILLLERLIEKVNNLIIGGAMAYTFVKAQGGQVGNSLVEDDLLDTAREVLEKASKNNVDIYLPIDSRVAAEFSNDVENSICASNKIPENMMGLDVGDEAIAAFDKVIQASQSILWNGPLGVFEMSNFSKGTFAIAKSVAEATSKGAYSLIGGGDSVSAINKSGLSDQVSHISTGGGAMLEYLEGKTLPGIQAILD